MATTISSSKKVKSVSKVQFNVRISPEEKRRIEAAANASRQSVTEFTQIALTEKADEVLARHESILLSDRDFDQFVAIMTADSEPTNLAKREAAEFSNGKVVGSRYKW